MISARDAEARVVEVVPHPLPYFTLVLDVPAEYRHVEPGQFVMLETTGTLEPYLRRAFSVADVSNAADGGARIELLAKIVGRGTGAMSRLRPGERRAILGPLGRPFTEAPPGRIALVAGGVGSAPLLIAARRLAEAGRTFDFFYGGRTARDLARRGDFERITEASGGRLIAATEDGSDGHHGRVTEALAAELDAGATYSALRSCGPMPMLSALARLAAARDLAGEAALETEMGCGFGACLGCAVPHVGGRYALCCKEGPVFRLDEVRW
jgi:dihydroorotate dehydrogenase electron transfer subunit